MKTAINIRPYQIMCLICRLGKEDNLNYYFEEELDKLQKAIKDDLNQPLALCCNVESTFNFQNPRKKLDTPEGNLFNLRRDLSILQCLGLTPGGVYPASDLLRLFMNELKDCQDICGSPPHVTEQWKGCKFAPSGNYERGIKNAIKKLTTIRSDTELTACKKESAPFGPESPMNTLLYEPHIDIHCISYYNYEGTKFLDHVDNDVKHLKKPVWAVPYVVESVTAVKSPDWGYHHPSKEELRLEIVAAAASGAKGFMPWVGRLLDADRLQAFNEGATAVAKYEAFYMDGKRVDEKVVLVNPNHNVRHRVHELDSKLLLTLFNCSNKSLDITFKFNNKQQSATIKGHDFKQITLEK